MSISGSLASALSGLTAAARSAEIVSSNIANATTPGYGKREVVTSARVVGHAGQGVIVAGVTRASNLPLLGDRRAAQAAVGDSATKSSFYTRLEKTLGTPDQADSISGRVAALDNALIEAASHPESEPRLAKVLSSAKSLASQIATASKDVQAARSTADRDIGLQVDRLNAALDRTVQLNVAIRRNYGMGQDVSALVDQRQQVIDGIAELIPVRQVESDSGTVSLYSPGGGSLVDPRASVFGFIRVGTIAPGMTQASGGLSGLTLNGVAIATAGDQSTIRGGALAASFAVRDELGVTAQSQLDAVARDLVERFADPALDASRAPGDPGLFTDAGAAFDPLNETGLSARLRINAAADPANGGALWRLRDGLGAATAGPPGNNQLINDMRGALTTLRTPASGAFMQGDRSFSVLTVDLLSQTSANRLQAEGEASFATAKTDALRGMEAEDAVDTDQEMQSLLIIEQAYAANAKVISTVNDMIQTLLAI